MSTTTTTQVPVFSASLYGHYHRRLLERLVPSFFHVGYGEERPMPKNQGVVINFRRYTNLTAATTALTEGVTPAGSSLSVTGVSATVVQYGDYVIYSDWLDLVGLDGRIVRIIDDLQADQAADTLDQVCRDVLLAGTNVRYCTTTGTAARTSVDDDIEDNDMNHVENYFERNSVKVIRDRITPGTGVGTAAVDPGYLWIGHPDCRYDIEALTGFVAVRNYAQPGKALPGEIGARGRFRFIVTPNAKITLAGGAAVGATGMRSAGAVSVDVYQSICFGKGFYGNVSIGPRTMKMIIKALGDSGSEDPLNQRASVGWKANFVSVILNETCGYRIESGATAITAA